MSIIAATGLIPTVTAICEKVEPSAVYMAVGVMTKWPRQMIMTISTQVMSGAVPVTSGVATLESQLLNPTAVPTEPMPTQELAKNTPLKFRFLSAVIAFSLQPTTGRKVRYGSSMK